MLEALGCGGIPAQSCVGETQKEQLRDKIGKNSMWIFWAELCVGRVVYSLEGKDKEYEFDVDFQ